MRSPRSALLLVPVLLAGAMPARAQPPTCQAGAPRLELPATPSTPIELCIQSGQFTALLFDGPLMTGAVVLEGREHFREVEAAGKMLMLVPSNRLPPGARLSLEVRFADGQVPESARFTLVAHPEQAARQVEVSRPAATAGICEAGKRQLQDELAVCQAQVASLSAQQDNSLDFVRALKSGKLDDAGYTVHPFTARDFAQGPGESLKVRGFTFYRSRGAMALRVRVKNEGPDKPWVLERARLLGRNGEELWATAVDPKTPLAPGATETRWVEWDLPPPKDKETSSYTLHLWGEGNERIATVPGLKLP
jgi:uncharacterized protein (TIGR02268 family)